MNVFNKVTSIIISVLLITVTLFLSAYILLRSSFLNDGFNVWCLSNSNYVGECSENISKSLINLSQSAGISEEVIKNSLNKGDLENDLIKYYTATSNYLERGNGPFIYIVDTKAFEDRLYSSINSYLSKSNIVVDKNSEKGINALVKESAKLYANNIMANNDLIKVFNKFFSIYVKFKMYAFYTFLILLVALIIINYRTRSFIRYIGASFTISGSVIIIAYLISVFSGMSHRLNLNPNYYKRMIEAVFSGFLFDASILGGGLLCVGLLCIYGYSIIARNNTTTHKISSIELAHITK